MNNKRFFPFLYALVLGMNIACSSGDDESAIGQFVQETHIVKGKIEKGPMVRGSSVEMRTLDKDLVATGSSYSTTIENDQGDFYYDALKLNSPYAKFTADGYFFNEVSGELSTAPIKLNAIADLSDNSTINVNVLTHLKSKRIEHLVTSAHLSFSAANKQAQQELFTQFGLQQHTSKDAGSFSITGGNDAAGVLIAVSAYVLSDRSEAEVVEFLSKLTTEFATTGRFSAQTQERLKSTRNYLNSRLEEIAQHIRARYQELGHDITVPNLAYYFDWDNDGIAGNEVDENTTVTLSQNELIVPAEGGEYTITIHSDKQYYLEAHFTSTDSDSGLDLEPGYNVDMDSYFNSFYATYTPQPDIQCTKEIIGNAIKICVKPAEFGAEKSTLFNIYNARASVAATVTLKQKGNPNIHVDVPKLGVDGEAVVAGMMSSLRDAYKYKRQLEGEYALQEIKRPYSANDARIANCWSRFYSAINNLLAMKEVDGQALNCYQPYLNTYIALAYYSMSSHWGGLPFFTTRIPSNDHQSMPQTSEREILDSLAVMLEADMADLEEKKNDAFTDANSMLFVSRDVSRILQAYIYCNLNKYEKALPLLEKVISNNYYTLNNSAINIYANNSECILGLVPETRAGETCYPCLDYKDVLLTTAECHYHLGNSTKAEYYLSQLCTAKGLSIDQSNILHAIAEIRFKMQPPNYLAYIRRNNLGKSALGLHPSDTYQLLWPIPADELKLNTSLIQNPGY